jgi:F-type H+-transporting ATPase subunit b
MLHLLAPLPAVAASVVDASAVDAVMWQAASQSVGRAGLIDLDVTLITQALFFFTLLIVLPPLVFKPLLARFEQREARTEGARHEAKQLRKQADDEVARYETLTSEHRRAAMQERAETRQSTQKQADALVAQARAESATRLEVAFQRQRATADEARAALRQDASLIAASIADKLARR